MSIWARVFLSPTSKRVATRKLEVRVRSDSGLTQLWAEPSDTGATSPDIDAQLIVLRFPGSRRRAELSMQDPANRLPGVRSVTWTMNPPGSGATSGPLTVERYLSSALDVFDFLSKRYAGVPLWLYGKSIGATIAVTVAAQRQPTALIARNILDVPAVAARRLRAVLPAGIAERIGRSAPAALSPLLAAPQAHCPALFVISREDRLATPATQEAIAHALGGPAMVLQVDGDHDGPSLHAEDESKYADALATLWRASLPSGS